MEEPTRDEKKSYLRVLSSLAWADGVVATEEFEVLHLAANDLNVALSERDLEAQDLEELAKKIEHPDLRRRLLDELARLAAADGVISPEEVALIRFFATRFQLDPPALEGVDWAKVPELEWAEDQA